MRGDIWQPTATTPTGLAAWLEISADELAAAPTVTVAAISTEPLHGIGWPLAIPIPQGLLGRTAWIRASHIHTTTRGELGQHVGRLPLLVVRRIDDALRRVLGINTIES